jgi:hypothetical protein
MGWATFWAIFSRTRLVTPLARNCFERFLGAESQEFASFNTAQVKVTQVCTYIHSYIHIVLYIYIVSSTWMYVLITIQV